MLRCISSDNFRKQRPAAKALAVLISAALLASALLLNGCTVDTGIEPFKATEKQITAASETAGRNSILIGCWIPPRPHQMTNDEEAEARMKEVAESGINYVTTHHSDLSDMDFIHRLIRASAKYGVGVMIELDTDLSDEGIAANLEVVKATAGYGNVIGYNLYDEPIDAHREALTREYGLVKELAPDKTVMLNLLPNYGPAGTMAPAVKRGLTAYRTYVENFIGTGTEAVSFDYYPFSVNNEGAAFAGFLSNCSDILLASRKSGLPIWGFIQDCELEGLFMPEEEALRMLTHLHLLFQVRNFSYFLYAQPAKPGPGSAFSGMLGWNSKLTSTYYRVQKNNKELDNFGYRVLSYDLKGIYTGKLTEEHKKALNGSLKLSSGSCFKSLSFEGDTEIIAGVFKPRTDAGDYASDTGEEAVYVINFNHSKSQSVTVNFKGVREYTVWGPDGIEDMGAASSVEIRLSAGDARFIEFKTFIN